MGTTLVWVGALIAFLSGISLYYLSAKEATKVKALEDAVTAVGFFGIACFGLGMLIVMFEV